MRLLFLLFIALLMNSAYGFEYTNKQGKKREMPEMHHILDVELLPEMKPPESFKTDSEGVLQCATCHGIKDIFDISLKKIDTQAENFLRGGPYQKLTQFCYQCHEEKANTRKNIHQLLDENGDIIEEKCKFCHAEVLDRDEAKDLDELKLRQPAAVICFACHLKTPHLNALEHLVELKDDKLQHWKDSTKQQNIYMPLSEKGEVMCVTCHTPHQKGVLDASLPAAKQVEDDDLEKGVSYQEHPWGAVYKADKQVRLDEYNKKNNSDIQLQYQRIHTEVLLRLPAKNGKLCLSCHTFDY